MEKIKQFKDCKGLIKVVTASELQSVTNLGWELIGMYQENIMATRWGNGTEHVGQDSSTHFIVRLNEELALALKESELTSCKGQLHEKTVALKEVQDKLLKTQSILEGTEKMKKLSEDRVAQMLEDIKKLRISTHAMESDLGKIREFLGTNKMNSILKSEDSSV